MYPKFKLTDKNISKRLLWCQKHMTWPREKWDRVMFSDESKVELHPKSTMLVWRHQSEKYSDLDNIYEYEETEKSYLYIWG